MLSFSLRRVCRSSPLRRQALRWTASALMLSASAGVWADTLTPQLVSCADRAATARAIATDRDAGMSQQDELHKLREEVAGAPVQQQIRSGAFVDVLVQRIYGMYTDYPPQRIYAGYLKYCQSRGPGYQRAP